MKLLWIFSLSAVLFICFTLTGQNSNSAKDLNSPAFEANNEILFYCRPALENELKGTEFLDSTWQSTVINTKTNKSFQIKGRYRMTKDEIQILYKEVPYTILHHHIDAILVGDRRFVPMEYKEGNQIREGYLECIKTGEMSLYRGFRKETDNQTVVRYYSAKKENIPEYLDTRKKMIIRHLKEKKVAMYNYIQSNKLKTEKAEDLIQIFEYYNSH